MEGVAEIFVKEIRLKQCHVKEQYVEEWKNFELHVYLWKKK
jgi:hypothetical protein